MLQDILLALWFLLPAAIANAAPVFSAKMPILKRFNYPLDGGKSWRGRRIFGSHKTWRGLLSGIVAATVVLWIQQLLFVHTGWADVFTAQIDYAALPVLLLGPAFAIGALGGDAIESFFKRYQGIKSGKAWFPFDQLDYIIGSVLISLFFVILTPLQYVFIFVLYFVLHIIAGYIGYRVGLKKEPI